MATNGTASEPEDASMMQAKMHVSTPARPRVSMPPPAPRRATLVLAMLAAGMSVGCSLDGLLKSDELPPTVTDPAITETPEGALAAYRGTVAQFRSAFGATGSDATSVITAAGLLSDELRSAVQYVVAEDARFLPENTAGYSSGQTYSRLQKVRGQANQAIGLLQHYRTGEPALAGHVYALAGYAEVFLAELFCSGIPLSTLDYGGDYTYHPGSSTEDVFAHARALFDTALALSGDSVTITNLARIGLARALLASGRYADAGEAAAAVPDGYQYALSYPGAADTMGNTPNFARVNGGIWAYGVGDREGTNGLDYVTSDDPRVRVSPLGTIPGGDTQWHPDQYAADGSSPIVVASGVEARLVEAEAALQAGGGTTWLDLLNALRTDGTQDGIGTYNPGSGGIAGLAPLSDPGTDSARVALVFRERAFWLFLTGHRQGDLRRLLRQYPQYWPTPDRVYPAGLYRGGEFGRQYGNDVTAPIPAKERLLNSLFSGCASRQP